MAARTLVAYERADGYDLHYAHDGGDLRGEVTPTTPFGGPADRDSTVAREALRERGVEPMDPHAGGTVVDPAPLARGVAWDALAADLDYRTYEWCVRVAIDWTVTAFLALFFGFGDRDGRDLDARGDGALLALGDGEGADAEAYARGWFEGTKSATADGLRLGLYGESAARGYLRARVRSFAGDREVYCP